jgi:hypothetical protein
MVSNGGAELGQHGRPGDAPVRSYPQGIAGVVIKPGQDLGAGPVCQWVMGEVRLPALVGQLGGEPQVRGSRPLARLGSHQPGPGQVTADRRRRHPDLVMVFQVPGDRVRPGVQALPSQVLPQPHDQLHRGLRDGARGGLGPS